jgi:putative NADH-flavin reductase
MTAGNVNHLREKAMLITVFGANGGTGRHVVEEALELGHEVHAVVRDPASLDVKHERLTVVRGDVLDEKTLDVRGEAVVSCIGARSRKAGRIASEGTANILAAMKRAGVERFVSISAAPLGDAHSFFERILFGILWRAFREVYEDLRRMETLTFESNTAWTVTRPPRLTNGPRTKHYQTAIDRVVGSTISRADLASEMLRCLGDESTKRHTLGIGY